MKESPLYFTQTAVAVHNKLTRESLRYLLHYFKTYSE